jgi:hypothetical protein
MARISAANSGIFYQIGEKEWHGRVKTGRDMGTILSALALCGVIALTNHVAGT